MEQVMEKHISLKEGALKLKISYRQAKRIKQKYQLEGDKSVIHGNTGKPSPRRIPKEIRTKAITLYAELYRDFGPTLASEKLLEIHGIKVHPETLRRWLIAESLWKKKRKRKIYRSRRERRQCFGELIQFDGSHHDWFEGRREKCCLMTAIDDATGEILSFFCEQETTIDAMMLIIRWVFRYGIPQAAYCDKKNAFVLNREPSIEEQLAGIVPLSHFERACAKLGIEVIIAHSPQAKGRIERNHAIHQDRLTKELRLAQINTIKEANEFLETIYLPKINKKFAKTPACSANAHVPLLENQDLFDIFCFETTRVISNDYMVSYKKRLFQIHKDQKIMPKQKDKVIVRELLDHSIKLVYKNTFLSYNEKETNIKKEKSSVVFA